MSISTIQDLLSRKDLENTLICIFMIFS